MHIETRMKFKLIAILALTVATWFLYDKVHLIEERLSDSEITRLENSVVRVLNEEKTGGGTGFLVENIDGKRFIVTNDHVCDVQSGGRVLIGNGSEEYQYAHIVARDFEHDLCALTPVDGTPIKIARKPAKRKQRIFIAGHPFLKPLTPSEGVILGEEIGAIGYRPDESGNCKAPAQPLQFLFGTICALRIELGLTSASIYPGNSGSPVVNADGELVGVVNSSDEGHHGGFIPLRNVKQFIYSL